MTTPLRICCLAYLIAITATVALLFGVVEQAWPAPAVEYFKWFASQPRGPLLGPLPYLGLLMLAISWLSAGALLFGQTWARWPFALAVAVVLFSYIAVVLGGQPPQLISALESSLNEATSVLAGLIIGLSFCPTQRATDAAL